MAVFLVDGDNNPGKGPVTGTEFLTKEDRVIVFYASNNTYYKVEKNRESLIGKTSADVEFSMTACGKNAADFAIAIKACSLISEESLSEIFLISSDAHFDIIANLLKEQYGDKIKAKRVASIMKGILYSPDRITDLDIAKEILKMIAGEEGTTIYIRLKELIEEETLRTLRGNAERTETVAGQRQGLLRKLLNGKRKNG